MKQLKFNPDKDIKELEKYEFKKVNYVNFFVYKYETDYNNIIIGPDRIVHYNDFTVHNELEPIIYDLIKTNLLIVESDKDE